MSRRCHHGSPRHVRAANLSRRPMRPLTLGPESGPTTGLAANGALEAEREIPIEGFADAQSELEALAGSDGSVSEAPGVPDRPVLEIAPPGPAEPRPPLRMSPRPRPAAQRSWGPRPLPAAPLGRPAADDGAPADVGPTVERAATAPQLRRFIKSRAYVPMHELRRRFGINGQDDDVTPVDVDRRRVFVGLPEREGRLLGELLRGGDIGYELSLDPISPIVVGVYPMRPVTRP